MKHALEVYADIDVVTTSEVHSHLVMQGFGAHVADSHISNHALTAAVEGSIDDAIGSMDWMPSVVSLAIIAFTAYNERPSSFLWQLLRPEGTGTPQGEAVG